MTASIEAYANVPNSTDFFLHLPGTERLGSYSVCMKRGHTVLGTSRSCGSFERCGRIFASQPISFIGFSR